MLNIARQIMQGISKLERSKEVAQTDQKKRYILKMAKESWKIE